MNVGILGYGVCIPQYRIKISDIAYVWGKNASDVKKSLGVSEKAQASLDEDAVTLAYEASCLAFTKSNIRASEIQVCFVGSESHPYAVNPTSTIVGEFLGIEKNYLAADLKFACKAATSGMIAVSAMISQGMISKGLVIGSDKAQAKPHDILEYTAASAASALVLGNTRKEYIAELIDFVSFSSDTPDFWRRDGVRFPSHAGRFTGEPAYFTHIEAATKLLLDKTKMKPADFDYCVFHMPNGKFPRVVAKRLGFSETQLKPSFVVEKIGNPYSASALIGLSAVLDIANEGQLIFMASYGSGAGSDGFVFKTSRGIDKKRKLTPSVSELIKNKKYISYIEYLRYTRKI